MIRLEGVTKTYKGSVTALREVQVDIAKGEFVFLVGPSGSASRRSSVSSCAKSAPTTVGCSSPAAT